MPTATRTDQLRLLDLQALDARLDRLAHRRRTLPELAEIDRVQARLVTLHDLIVAAETEQSDIAREQVKAEADVEQVRARAARDQQLLDAGTVGSARELENLQHEIASLQRRQGDLEDVVLEIMERLEQTGARLGELTAERDQAAGELVELERRRDDALGEIDAEAGELGAQRAALRDQIDAALMTMYERIRDQQGGVGAAPLRQRRCEGCRLELNTVDLNRIREAPEDQVIRCEECGRILVRTDESGL